MKTLIALIAIGLVLPGCSSTPVKTTSRQYCHTKQDIRLKNGETVSSDTEINCNDDPIEQMTVKKMGIAQNCGEYKYFVTLNGQVRERYGYACQKLDGRWEVVPHPSSFQ